MSRFREFLETDRNETDEQLFVTMLEVFETVEKVSLVLEAFAYRVG